MDEPMTVIKSTFQWSETRWYVECPYCDHLQGAEETEFDEETDCEKCNKTFKVEGGSK